MTQRGNRGLRTEVNNGMVRMAGGFSPSFRKQGSPSRGRPPMIDIPSAAKWRPLSPRSADHLLGGVNGPAGPGAFGETFTPGGSPVFPSSGRRDSRRRVLLNMTYANLFLAFVLIVIGSAGPEYPGHSGTTDNIHSDAGNLRRLSNNDNPLYEDHCPTSEVHSANGSILHSALIVGVVIWLTQPWSARSISLKVDRMGAAVTLLTSVVSAFTCFGALVIVMVDINYISLCCSLLEDNCEESNLCTEYVSDCCIGDDVAEYCGTHSYHVAAVSMIFLVFVSTSAMMMMSGTMSCRCWLDSDPEKQAMMMVMAGSPMMQNTTQPGSPKFSPRTSLLTALGDGKTTPQGPTSPAGRWAGTATTGSITGSAPRLRQTCTQCGAVFGDADTLRNHTERFHPSKGRNSAGAGDARRTGEPTIPTNARSGKRKSSAYIPDEGPLISVADMNPSDRDAGY